MGGPRWHSTCSGVVVVGSPDARALFSSVSLVLVWHSTRLLWRSAAWELGCHSTALVRCSISSVLSLSMPLRSSAGTALVFMLATEQRRPALSPTTIQCLMSSAFVLVAATSSCLSRLCLINFAQALSVLGAALLQCQLILHKGSAEGFTFSDNQILCGAGPSHSGDTEPLLGMAVDSHLSAPDPHHFASSKDLFRLLTQRLRHYSASLV